MKGFFSGGNDVWFARIYLLIWSITLRWNTSNKYRTINNTKMENNRFCIVHYENKEPYSKLKDVNELNESRIREAKEKGEQLSGETSRKTVLVSSWCH